MNVNFNSLLKSRVIKWGGKADVGGIVSYGIINRNSSTNKPRVRIVMGVRVLQEASMLIGDFVNVVINLDDGFGRIFRDNKSSIRIKVTPKDSGHGVIDVAWVEGMPLVDKREYLKGVTITAGEIQFDLTINQK